MTAAIAGAPPSPTLLGQLRELNFRATTSTASLKPTVPLPSAPGSESGMKNARIDHRFGNEGDFGRPERFSGVSLSIRSRSSDAVVWMVVNEPFFGLGRG